MSCDGVEVGRLVEAGRLAAGPGGGHGATVNPSTLCAPLGAVLASLGLRKAMPLLHGAQGCATYIRRYLISHFREPVDVASSSFGEAQTVFGGESNFHRALDNVISAYNPEVITVATTCLSETIGEDVRAMVRRFGAQRDCRAPIVSASTPSFKDGHAEGFHEMVRAIVGELAVGQGEQLRSVNVLPPLVSPADLRHLREMVESLGVAATILPDYSDTLDGAIAAEPRALPEGGTSIAEVNRMARALGTIDLTMTGHAARASDILSSRGCPAKVLGLPIGLRATDAFFDAVSEYSGAHRPHWLAERGRLLDAYADGHKVVFGVRVAVYGEPELVAALAGFLVEVGARPVICATGARNRALPAALNALPGFKPEVVLDDADFASVEAACRSVGVDMMMGSSKGYGIARSLGIPLVRIGFPVHDRLGAGRILTVGYRGTMRLFDELVNTVLQRRQDDAPIAYSYL